MAKKMLIDATHAEETRVVVVDGNKVEEFDFESENKRQLAGNIYLAKVTRVEPSLQAAFVDYGGNRHGFLAFSEIHPDYYQIPVADREALMEEERAYAEAMRARDEDDEPKPTRSRRKGRGGKSRGSKAAAQTETATVENTTASTESESSDVNAAEPQVSSENGAVAQISGMETIDLGSESGSDSVIADVPETSDAVALEATKETPTADVASEEPTSEIVEPATQATRDAEAEEAQAAVVTDYVEAQEVAEAAPVSDVEPSDEVSDQTETEAEESSDETPKGPSTIAAEADKDDAVISAEVPSSADGTAEHVDTETPETVDAESSEQVGDAPAADETAPKGADAEEVGAELAEEITSDDVEEDQSEKRADATSKDDSIESVADEDDSEDIRPARKPRPRRYKIQEVIKVRQVLLVQVVKEERGNKGAALTTYLSLAGRYCVLMPNTARGGGISRKITNVSDRKKLKEIATELDVPTGAGLIVRTAGAKRTKAEIKRDYEYLQRLWEQIRELTLKSIAPAKIYEEGDLIKRSIRDLYNREIDEVLVEGERGYRIAKDFMKMIMPSHAKNVKHYQDQMPLFARYQVESYLGGMFNPTVQLKSGGYIVIGVTEALVAIDVNSGRATKEGSIEETALKTNLEAAEEVARQLRLRDLAGLIVIDFIDMDERKNNAAVEKRMKDKLKTDRARIQVGRISGFGLMEMSRQRLRPGMIEATTQPCPHCHGTGLIRSDDSMALSILRQIEEEGTRGRSREVLVRCPVPIANFLMNQKREHIAQIEARYGLSVRIEGDVHLVSPDFTIEKFKTASRTVVAVEAPVVSVDTSIMDEVDAEDAAQTIEGEATDVTPEAEDTEQKPKRKRRRRRRRKSNGDEQNTTETKSETEEATSDEAAEVETAESDASVEGDTPPKEEKKRRTRTRTRRRSKDKVDIADDTPAETEQTSSDTAAAGGDASVETAEEPAADITADVEPMVEEAPAVQIAPEEPAVEVPVEASSEEETPTVETMPESDVVVADAAPASETIVATAASSTIPEVAAAANTDTAVALAEKPTEPAINESAEEAAPAKPKRRGWWSR
ncbi:Rne/Rng family ribonuclease [Epibacterium ulvae]|uniref:Rne/Rng family ribonuclease n=1 Tax=Epibacterium ulvae TaxID=1156985 RepID=UPI00248FDD58|nr:Rne/Rng family ribonuclease [Epibacterium ulvae]